jgi:Tfp pilus assembly protein PilX
MKDQTHKIKMKKRIRRKGVAILVALLVMAATTMVVVSVLDNQTMQFMALNNTVDYDRARYLAEAGMSHSLSILEQDITFRGTISETDFPTGSGNSYTATVQDGAGSTILISSSGTSGTFTRSLEANVKQGG